MVKKLTLLAMAVGAVVAFAVPAAASAKPVLTMPAKTIVPVGTTLTGTSFDSVTETPLGKLTCEEVMINAQVTKNSTASGIEAKGLTGNTTKNCKLKGEPITIEEPKLVTLTSTESGKGTASLSFISNSGIKCTWAGTAAVTYTTGTSSITLNGPVSGACGKGTFTGTYSLETTPSAGGGAVIISAGE